MPLACCSLPLLLTVFAEVGTGVVAAASAWGCSLPPAAWVHRLRDRGVTWTRIGEALGMARRSAWERFSAQD